MTAQDSRHFKHLDVVAANTDLGEKYVQILLQFGDESSNCRIRYIRTPPGGRSKRGMHTHEYQQAYYILQGVMTVEVDQARSEARPGDLVLFPAGVPHGNWNDGTEETVHLSIETRSAT